MLQGSFGGEDFVRGLVERTVQGVLEAEIKGFLGAGTYQRNEYKPRLLKTRVGKLELMVPKDREGMFQTEVFERYQRSEKALVSAMLEMYVSGVSTRKVSAITEALCGVEVSKSQVFALTQRCPYLVADARYEKVRQGGAVVSQGLLVVCGIDAAGQREVLGCWVAESESEASWGKAFAELKERGWKGVRYVVSDDHAGMVKAIDRYFQGAVWQR